MSTSVQHGHLLCPITALSIASEHVFAGEGSYLKCFDRQSGHLLFRERIFKSQAIHGIVCRQVRKGPSDLLIWGGRFVRLLQATTGAADNDFAFRKWRILKCSDWVLHASWSPELSNSDIDFAKVSGSAAVAVTAHNALLGLTFSSPQSTAEEPGVSKALSRLLEHQLSASTRCLLYTAAAKWTDHKRILIAAGTAFGEIIVWSYNIASNEALERPRIEVHYAFLAHDGSVFGVDICQLTPSTEGDQSRCILATCSDDRTIRVWDISQALRKFSGSSETIANRVGEVNNIPIPAAHGSENDLEVSQNSLAGLVAKTWAHNSRIWGVQFASFSSPKSVTLVSNGEDTTSQLWHLALDAVLDQVALTGKLTFMTRLTAHVGKNVWTLASALQQNHIQLATGGADGRVVLACLPVPDTSLSSHEFAEHQLRDQKVSADPYKAYCFIGNDTLLLTTRRGFVVRAQVRPRIDGKQRIGAVISGTSRIDESLNFANYSIVAGLATVRVGFVTGSTGEIFEYDSLSETFRIFGSIQGKVAGMFTQATETKMYLLASAIGRPEATLFMTGLEAGKRGSSVPDAIRLELSKGYVVESMLVVEAADYAIIFLGLRSGKIIRLVLPSGSEVVSSQSIVGSHEDGVTSMLWKAVEDCPDEGYLLTTARDTSYAIHYVSNAPVFTSARVHSASLSFGPNIEGAFIRSCDDHLILYGFHGTNFVIYDETAHLNVTTIECGGAHRVWAFRPSDDAEGGTLVWTKASEMDAWSYTGPVFSSIKHSGHGREIKACAVCPMRGADDSYIIATGAEDTDIRIFQTMSAPGSNGTTDMTCIMLAKKHNTGLQQLSWSSNGEYLFSSASSEEFLVWRTRKVPFVRFGLACESKLPSISQLPDLRIMSFTIDDYAAEISHGNGASFNISLAFSDSSFRSYRYTSNDTTWHLLSTGNYTTCCLTQIMSLSCLSPENSARSAVFATAATDGTLALWQSDTDPHMERGSVTRNALFTIHQNSIKDLLVLSAEKKDVLIATVGDDNSLALTRIVSQAQDQGSHVSVSNGASASTSPPGPAYRCKTLLIPNAHAAAINAMVLISSSETEWTIASSGNDQVFKVWRVSFDRACKGVDGVDVKLLHALPTAVADVSAMDIIRHSSYSEVIVCGVGIEFFILRNDT